MALAALLLSHWPELGFWGGQLRLTPTTKADMQSNAAIVVKMVEELQLPWNLQVRPELDFLRAMTMDGSPHPTSYHTLNISFMRI